MRKPKGAVVWESYIFVILQTVSDHADLGRSRGQTILAPCTGTEYLFASGGILLFLVGFAFGKFRQPFLDAVIETVWSLRRSLNCPRVP